MKDTYANKGRKTALYITPRDMGINDRTYFSVKETQNSSQLFTSLIMQTPTNQSHLGDKWDRYTGLNNNTLDEFARKLIKALDVKDVYIFSVMEPKHGSAVNNAREDVIKSGNTMLCLYIGGNGLRNSLYASIRNALAHGNIVDNGNNVCLYSVSERNKNYESEFDTPLSFYLRIYSIDKLEAYLTVLKEYR
jgi:hypothetical protein